MFLKSYMCHSSYLLHGNENGDVDHITIQCNDKGMAHLCWNSRYLKYIVQTDTKNTASKYKECYFASTKERGEIRSRNKIIII
jgi:hypothetical protein